VRQAVQFGNRWLAIGAALLLWPLFASLLAGNATIVIVLYVFAIALDIALFVVWLRAALRYSRQAARGETFSLRG
jgi:antibiotic biosynthesis monooxygenase (ABM) superfamily enzyme